MVLFLHVWQFGHLVPLHLHFQYFKNAIQSNVFFFSSSDVLIILGTKT